MDVLAKACIDVCFYYIRWIEIIPDEASDAELREIAQDDKGTFEDAIRVFINHFHKKVASMWGGERWPD